MTNFGRSLYRIGIIKYIKNHWFLILSPLQIQMVSLDEVVFVNIPHFKCKAYVSPGVIQEV